MKKRSLNALAVGLTATFASIMAFTLVGGSIANSYRSTLDGVFGTTSYVPVVGEGKFNKKFTTIDSMINAAKNVAINEGQQGTVVMKNDRSALPLAASSKSLYLVLVRMPHSHI